MARGSVKIALLLFLQILGINGFPYPEIQAAQAIPAIFNNQGKNLVCIIFSLIVKYMPK